MWFLSHTAGSVGSSVRWRFKSRGVSDFRFLLPSAIIRPDLICPAHPPTLSSGGGGGGGEFAVLASEVVPEFWLLLFVVQLFVSHWC